MRHVLLSHPGYSPRPRSTSSSTSSPGGLPTGRTVTQIGGLAAALSGGDELGGGGAQEGAEAEPADGDDAGDDALIFAEAWLNLHLGRAEASRRGAA